MNTKKCFSLVVVLFIVASAFAGNNKNSYSGVWKLNKEKTPPANSRLFLSQISFTLKGDSLLTVRTYENENGETYPFDEKLTMDGKEHKIEVYNFPRKAKAHWSEKWPEPAISKVCLGEAKLAETASQTPWPLLAYKKILACWVRKMRFMPCSHAAMVAATRGSDRSVMGRCMACMTSSGTWVGPGECTKRMPAMRGVIEEA